MSFAIDVFFRYFAIDVFFRYFAIDVFFMYFPIDMSFHLLCNDVFSSRELQICLKVDSLNFAKGFSSCKMKHACLGDSLCRQEELQ